MSRRRAALVIGGALLVALIVGELVDQTVNSYGPAGRTARASWLASVTPILTESGDLAPFVHEVRSSSTSGTCSLRCAIGVLDSESASQQAAYAALRLPAPSGIGPEVAEVLAARATGVQALVSAVSRATGPEPDLSGAASDATEAGRDFLRADRVDASLTAALHKAGSATPWATSWIASPPAWAASAASGFVRGLSNSPQLVSPNTLEFLVISLAETAPHAYVPALTGETTTTTTTTTTTLAPVVTGASGVVPPTTTTTSTTVPTVPVTTTTIAPIPAGFAQIPVGHVSELLAPVLPLRVVVVVANHSVVSRQVTISASLVARPAGTARTVHSAVQRLVAPDASVYVTLPPLTVSTKATSYNLEVRASAPGVARTIEQTLPLAVTN